MAKRRHSRSRGKSYDHRTKAEDAGLVLALVIIGVLGLTILAILLLEFFEVLPDGIDTIFVFSLLAFAVVLGRALLFRSLTVPPVYRGRVPSVRNHRG